MNLWFHSLFQKQQQQQQPSSLIKEIPKHILQVVSGSDCKESTWNAGDPGLIPGLGRSLGEGNGYSSIGVLQYSGLENSMDYTVPGVAQSQT